MIHSSDLINQGIQCVTCTGSGYAATYRDSTISVRVNAHSKAQAKSKLHLQLKKIELYRKRHPFIIFGKRTNKIVFRNYAAKGKWTRKLLKECSSVVLDADYFCDLIVCEFISAD